MRVRRLLAGVAVATLVLGACTIEQDLTPRVEELADGADEERSPQDDADAETASASQDEAGDDPTPAAGEQEDETGQEAPEDDQEVDGPVEDDQPPTDRPSEPAADEPTEPPTRPNRPPAADDDPATVEEDTAVLIDVLDGDVDPDGDALTITAVSSPTMGTAELRRGGVRYVPAPDRSGTDSFTYDISDGRGGTDRGTVRVTIAPVNDAPVARADGGTSAYLVQQGGFIVVTPLDNDTDVEGDSLTAEIVRQPDHGGAGCFGCSEMVEVVYAHDGTSTTSDRFTYRAWDGGLWSDTVTVDIVVNRTPVARNDRLRVSSRTVDEVHDVNLITGGFNGSTCCSNGESWSGVADDDPDGDALTFTGPRGLQDIANRPAWMTGWQCTAGGRCQGEDHRLQR